MFDGSKVRLLAPANNSRLSANGVEEAKCYISRSVLPMLKQPPIQTWHQNQLHSGLNASEISLDVIFRVLMLQTLTTELSLVFTTEDKVLVTIPVISSCGLRKLRNNRSFDDGNRALSHQTVLGTMKRINKFLRPGMKVRLKGSKP